MNAGGPHAHGHGGHTHGSASGRLGLAFVLNFTFTLVELAGAWWTNSTAIAADAIHDLGDTLSLAFAWWMQRVARRPPSETYSYGFRRFSLLGALVNAAVLVIGGALVLAQAIPRLSDPAHPDTLGMMGLAILGILVNGAAALRVRGGTTLNERVVTWHLIEDVLGWVAVLIVSIVMQFVDAPILDPILSMLIVVWIGVNAVRNLRAASNLFMQGVPAEIDIEALHALVAALPGVRELRHVHVWSQDAEHHVLTGSLLIDPMSLEAAIVARQRATAALHEAGVAHVTLELDTEPDDCPPNCA
jgi:cobalt-zinc-cadmium efflux system protein